ncbi:putative mitochondrial protein AtMg00820 [Apium graveolens]|uniref:putative mitochondrial protein AtMg00820 n=1 Tax=Apium graveolens TaxID=4045 RepID=UPI003D78DECF
MGIEEPINFVQAAKDRNWKMAMERELQSIEENRTWKLTELPRGQKAIGLKWIFKLKMDAQGNVVKHKERLITKGYVQEREVDFDEIFAPMTRLEIVRLLLALAAKEDWEGLRWSKEKGISDSSKPDTHERLLRMQA